MPHDNKGRKINGGDYVIAPAYHRANRLDVFKVQGVNESATSCEVMGIAQGIAQVVNLTAKDCEIVLKGDGLKPELTGDAPPTV